MKMSHAEQKATKNTLNAVCKWLSVDVLVGSRWLSTIVPPILNLNTRSLEKKWDGAGSTDNWFACNVLADKQWDNSLGQVHLSSCPILHKKKEGPLALASPSVP